MDPGHSEDRLSTAADIDRLRREGELDRAESQLEHALAHSPDDVGLRIARGRLLLARYRCDDAAEAFAGDDDRLIAWRVTALARAYRLDQAIAAATEALKAHPDSVWLRLALGRVHLDSWRPWEALAVFTEARRLAPEDWRATGWHAIALANSARMDEAMATAEDAVRRHPDVSKAHYTLGRVFFDRYEFEKAMECFDAALDLDPRHAASLEWRITALRYQYRLDEAQHAVEAALETLPGVVRLHVEHGWLLRSQNRYDEALAAVERALALDSRHRWALESRIAFLQSLRRSEEAVRQATDAIELQPASRALRLSSARLHAKRGDYDQAVEHVDSVLAITPTSSRAIRDKIDILTWAGRYDEADATAGTALEQHPDNPDVQYTLAGLYRYLNDYDRALAHCDRALAAVPRHANALYLKIRIFHAAKRFGEAFDTAKLALSFHPRDPAVLLTLASLHFDRDQHDDAMIVISRVLSVQPNNRFAAKQTIRHLRKTRRFDDAQRMADEARARITGYPDLHVEVAWLHADRNQADAALVSLDDALALDPRHEWALRSRILILGSAGRFADAEETATAALTLHPAESWLLVVVADLASDRHLVDEALSYLDRAIASKPFFRPAHRQKARLLRLARRFDAARRAVDDGLARFPDDAEMRVEFAWLHADLDRRDDALAEVDRVLEQQPEHRWALRSKVSLLRDALRFPEAAETASRMLDLHGGNPHVLLTAAWLHRDRDDFDRVLSLTERALALDNAHVEAYQLRVNAFMALNRFAEAEETARRGLTHLPHSVQMHVSMARVYDHVREFDRAERHFAEARAVNPDDANLVVAQSATLRSLRRLDEAERQVAAFCAKVPHLRAPRFELGWIHYDAWRLGEARRVFTALLKDSSDDFERAESRYALGWVAFAANDLVTAEKEFRAALGERRNEYEYMLALAWALTRQDGEKRWVEAETLAAGLLDRQANPSAHVCLGVLAFRRGRLASAEHHLKKALGVDPHHGSHADLGALYVQMGRYEEAEAALGEALARDWYDGSAHVELGALLLHLGDDRLPDAEREFRQALAIDPASGPAAIGLAQALTKTGDEAEAESVLRVAEQRQDAAEKWRTHLALARLLVQRGDKQQNPDLHAEAYAQAQSAIESAPDAEADPHFVAGVAHHRMGSLAADARGRFGYRVRAMHHLRECLKRERGHVEAQRNLQLLEREMKAVAPAIWGGYAVATISLLLLGTMWTAFFFSAKVTPVMLTVTTPVLVGLFTVAVLLPALIRLKLPGFEADLQAGSATVSPGPTGQVTFGPGRFTVTSGPTGQLPRRE